MSKKPNRNIKIKIDSASSSNNRKRQSADGNFGEPVPNANTFWNQMSDLSSCTGDHILENIATDNRSVSKSSSSSLSWGEECEAEATRTVQMEYDRMNRVLQGLEEIPPNYNKDEYKLWIKMFPCLRSTDTTTSKSRNRIRFAETQRHCDKLKPRSRNIVIDGNDIFGEPISDLPSGKKRTYEAHTSRRDVGSRRSSLKILEQEFENCLRISPAPTSTKPSPLARRRRSVMTSKCNEYVSLPYLPIVDDVSAKIKTSARSKPKDVLSRQKQRMFEFLPVDNNLVLPPISASQFRSISAIHFQPSMRSSAASTKTSLDRKDLDGIEVSRSNLIKRRSGNKSIKRFYCN